MSHLASRPAAALGGNEFVVFPECAIEKGEITFVNNALPFFALSRNAGCVEKSFLLVHQLNADHSFLRRHASPQGIAHVIRIASKERDGFAEETIFCAQGSWRKQGNEPVERQSFPLHRRAWGGGGGGKADVPGGAWAHR